jgi:hypothetical protein
MLCNTDDTALCFQGYCAWSRGALLDCVLVASTTRCYWTWLLATIMMIRFRNQIGFSGLQFMRFAQQFLRYRQHFSQVAAHFVLPASAKIYLSQPAQCIKRPAQVSYCSLGYHHQDQLSKLNNLFHWVSHDGRAYHRHYWFDESWE